MTDKGSAGKLLEKNIKRWEGLIKSLHYPACLYDLEFNIVMANKAFIQTCRIKDDVGGMKCHEALDFPSQSGSVETVSVEKSLNKESPAQFEVYEPFTKKILRVLTSPVVDEGTIIGGFITIVDITNIKKEQKDSEELVDIYAEAVTDLKTKEQHFLVSKEAFFNMLEDVSESYKALEHLFLGLVRAMVNALDAKSPWTKGHSENVAMYSVKIANELGLNEDQKKEIKLAGILHDIGKIGTYDYLLDKPGKLTSEEYEIVKKHPVQGAHILEGIKQLKAIIPVVRHHHERIDGKGYPDGLKGDEIPLAARIMHVADSFDSMTSDRPYRPAPTRDYAISEFQKYSGSQFDAEVVEAFLRVLKNNEKPPIDV